MTIAPKAIMPAVISTRRNARAIRPKHARAKPAAPLPAEGDSPRGRVLKKQPGTITAAFARSRDAARAKYVKECAREGVEADPDFLTNLHWHDLRHEATSRLFEEKGLNIMEVASVTGHKTLSMLKRYTHLKAQAIAKKLG